MSSSHDSHEHDEHDEHDKHDDEHGDGHGHGSRFIQHHYDDAQHQFDSGKLGIWVFLGQEILFFAGLFVAYIVYRTNHPEIFAYAHKYLDTNMGAINTGVLILSSLTAAWAVRAAQLQQKRILVTCLAVTILCACGFLVIKYIEYSHKVHIGTVFGERFKPAESPDGTDLRITNDKGKLIAEMGPNSETPPREVPVAEPLSPIPAGAEDLEPETGALVALGPGPEQPSRYSQPPPPNTAMFFTIYFAMTGLHGIHVVLGIFVFIWLLVRAIKDHFTPDYYGPVDYAALYWHLVDLIWIYLFPLLYLIH